ncbi:MAG: alpha/beta hydrolase [Clostridia bacterium]|nr:alpha/beta hydrolase [Clostridia bacterium]
MIYSGTYAQEMTGRVEPALREILKQEQVNVRGGQLSVSCYIPRDAESVMLLLHGTSESAEKYHEMIWMFNQMGIGIVAPDMRGHGKSLRMTGDPCLVYVDRFEDYVDDAETVLGLVQRVAGDRPLQLFGHSLGGAVAAALMIRLPDTFTHVILSSPMVDPSTGGLPRWAGKGICTLNCLLGRGKKMAFVSGPYNAETDVFENSCDTGRERFEYYKGKRVADRDYQTSPLTYRWIRESFGVRDKLLKAWPAEQVKSNVLLCQAGRDTLVSLPEQEKFIRRIKNGRLVCFESAKHEIYFSDDETVERYLKEIENFIRQEAPNS